MEIFHLHYRGLPRSFFKLFTISFPLFCLLISWAASTTTSPSPPSSLAAAEAIRNRGYSLFAAIIDATATDANSWNGTGTILAPPDFAFSFATAKFNSHRRAPPRPSTSLLLYHTLKQTLTWHNLTTCSDGHELRTLYENRCVFVSTNLHGELSVAGTKKTVMAVKIRQPDLYVDDQLTVHGVDSVLDPSSASKCSFPEQSTVEIKTEIDGSYLDHAVRALRRRGFSMVATAMAIKRSDLMSLTTLTVFAPSDLSLFSASNGFRYDFRYHVVPNRIRFADLARLPVGTEIETIAPNKTVMIGSVNGVVTVNDVPIDGSEIYHNQWVVVVSVRRTFDDAEDSEVNSQFSSGFSNSGRAQIPSTAPSYSIDSDVKTQPSDSDGVPSPAHSYYGDSKTQFPVESPLFGDAGIPSPSPIYTGQGDSIVGQDDAVRDSRRSPAESPFADVNSSPAKSPFANFNSSPAESPFANLNSSPTVSPVCSNGVVSTISEEVEGQDLFCPLTVRTEAASTVHVDQSSSSADRGQLSEESTQSASSDARAPSDEQESGPLSEIPSVEMAKLQAGTKTSGVTFSKSNNKCPINASHLDPNLVNRFRNQRNLQCPSLPLNKSISHFGESGFKLTNHGDLFGYSSKPTSQISHPSTYFNKICGRPIGFSSKPASHILRAAAPDSPQEANPDGAADVSKRSKTFQLAIVFGLWYFQNIVFNIYNKKALNIFPFPWLLASFQLFVGSLWMLFLWSFKLQPCPKISKPFIVALLGPALFHTIGHISACVSFSKVAVSFTHVIKSSEPVFSVVFLSFLGDTYPIKVWLSILPIVLGCSLAAVTEVSFNFQGLWGALISNVGFVLRNIYSKKSLQSFKEVNGLNLYGWISIISLFYLFPVAVFVEGSQWVAGYRLAIQSIGKPSTFYLWVILSGVFYHLYNQSSYQALDDISPLTFSVGNTMKRVVVIVSTVLVFRNPVRPLNALGSAIAIFGTFLYSQATSTKSAKKIEGEKKS
ncbi:hypothetical protein F0562_018636 [Nyssa sinensis]|uniref:FAS1 domain-containing protein n=1 Tax=Nyssa sinensis TaxID=561372 RepID=A0A5J4ZAD3_9ASTE|nr:hypothetical protein F0562_018636 [Nyssa sinensis]